MDKMFKVDSLDGLWDNGNAPTSYLDLGFGGTSFVHLIVRKNTGGGGTGVFVTTTRRRVGRLGVPIKNACGTNTATWVTGPAEILDFSSNSIKQFANFVTPAPNYPLCYIPPADIAYSGSLERCNTDSVIFTVATNQNIQWYRNDTAILGESSNTLVAKQTGQYKAVLNKCICYDTLQSIAAYFLPPLRFSPSVLLQGSFQPAQQTMSDSLQRKNLLNVFLMGNPDTLPQFASLPTFKSQVSVLPDSLTDIVKISLRDSLWQTKAVQYAWLHQKGKIYDYETASKNYVQTCLQPRNYYVQVEHRNHLPLVSVAHYLSDTTITHIDLTQISKVYGGGAVMLSWQQCGMIAGDVNKSNLSQINANDLYDLMENELNFPIIEGYYQFDANLDGFINAKDFNVVSRNSDLLYFSTVP
jgi:hypothetical protein